MKPPEGYESIFQFVVDTAHNCEDDMLPQVRDICSRTGVPQGFPLDNTTRIAKHVVSNYITLAIENENWDEITARGQAEKIYRKIKEGALEHSKEEFDEIFGFVKEKQPKDLADKYVAMLAEPMYEARRNFKATTPEKERKQIRDAAMKAVSNVIDYYYLCMTEKMRSV